MTTIIFNRNYCEEELSDLERDVSEAFDPLFNHNIAELPEDDLPNGVFNVTITWSDGSNTN